MAKGNTLLLPSWMTSVVEWLVLRSSPILDSLGSLVARLTGDRRWSYLGYHIWDRVADLVKRFRTNRRHSLAIEILNPTDRTVELVLQISVDRSRMDEQSLTEDIPIPFLQTLRLDPGHFSEIVPGDSFAAIADSGLPYEIALDPLQEDTHLVFLTLELIESPERLNEEQAETQDPPVKCVIFDLDQTLWGWDTD